jgi:hypothetical protein
VVVVAAGLSLLGVAEHRLEDTAANEPVMEGLTAFAERVVGTWFGPAT